MCFYTINSTQNSTVQKSNHTVNLWVETLQLYPNNRLMFLAYNRCFAFGQYVTHCAKIKGLQVGEKSIFLK